MPIPIRRKAPCATGTHRPQEASAHRAGKLPRRAQGGLAGGCEPHEAAVLPVPNLVFHLNLVPHFHRVSGHNLLIVPVEAPLQREAVPGRLNLPERSLISGRQSQHPRIQNGLGAIQHRGNGVDEGRRSVPLLRLFLQHEPEANAVGNDRRGFPVGAGNDGSSEELAQESMGIGLVLQQAAEGHHGIGIVPAAVPVLHGIFQEGENIGPGRFLQLGTKTDAPSPGQRLALRRSGKAPERQQPAGLGKNLPLQPAALFGRWRQIALGIFPEFRQALLVRGRYRLHRKGNLRIKGPHPHVLRVRNPAAPVRKSRPELLGIQEFNTGRYIRHRKAPLPQEGEALQQHRRDDGIGRKAFEPAEASVRIPAGHHLLQEPIIGRGYPFLRVASRPCTGKCSGKGIPFPNGESGGHEAHIPGLGEGEDVVAAGLQMSRDGVFHHVQDGDFLELCLVGRNVHEAGTELPQEGVAVHGGEQHGGVRLRELLRGGVHRHLHTDAVGEVRGHEGGGERQMPDQVGHDGRPVGHDGNRKDMGDGGAGLNGYGNLLHGVSGAEHQGAGNRLVRNGRHRHGSLIHIPGIKETGFHQGNLHRQGDHQLLLHQGIVHGPVVRVRAYIIGGKLVRSVEAHVQRAIGPGLQMRLEGKGRCKHLPGHHPGIRRCGALGLGFLQGHRILHDLHALYAGIHHHRTTGGRRLEHGPAPTVGGRNMPADGIQGNPGHLVIPEVHNGPVVALYGVQALVPGGHQQLGAGGRAQGKAVLRSGIGLVFKTGEGERQGIAVLLPAIHPLKADGLAVPEIEHHQAHRVRILLLIREGQKLYTPLLRHKLAGREHLPVFPEERGNAINGTRTAAYAGLDALSGHHFQGTREKDALYLRPHGGGRREYAEQLLLAFAFGHSSVRFQGVHIGFQSI